MSEENQPITESITEPITEESVQERVSEATTPLQERIDELETEVKNIGQVKPDAEWPWQKDPNWKAKDYDHLMEVTGQWLEKKGGFSKVQKEEIVKAVVDEIAAQNQTKVLEVEEANKIIDQEIAAVKKTDADADVKSVLEYINDWNKDHVSKITSFKDGYDLYKQSSPAKLKEKASSRSAPISKATAPAGEDNKPKYYRRGMSVDDVLAKALAEFET